jgi:aryl-phospho-beta-D-glucosidase BglC (GH1 family)
MIQFAIHQIRNLSRIALIIPVFLISSACLSHQDTGSSDNDELIPSDPFELNEAMQQGINLGNALEAPQEGDWGMVIMEEYIHEIAEAGFDAIRIPIKWNAHADYETPYVIDPAFFHRVDEIINWAGDEAEEWVGTTWEGTPGEMSTIDESFDNVLDWANQYNRPIHLGEFGAYQAAPYESRILWTNYVRKAAEQRNFSWAYWEFGAGFGAYDRDNSQWRVELIEALIP